ncbi:MAG: peroxiredoxin family protein [Bacteroidales bacterium]|nr:peroxiredoxin family protein [Bacteroidales bacterium]
MFRNFIFILFLAIIACSSEKKSGTIHILGQLPKHSGEYIFLEELDVRKSNLIDSAEIDRDGAFDFEVDIEDAGFYVLRTTRENYILLLVEKEENVEINSGEALFENGCMIEGSAGSKFLMDFEKFMKNQKMIVDSLAIVFQESRGLENFLEIKQDLDSVYMNVFEAQREYVINFIEQNSGSLASLIVLNRKLGNNVVLDEVEDFIYFHKIDSALMVNHPENKHTIDHHKRVEEIRGDKFERFYADKKLEPGNKAPNIVLKDTSGQFISLKDLSGQKVLIYFWAGWNAKSRQDNRKLVSLYPKFKESNMEILGVSLDENEKVWKGALNLDRLPWINGSELKGLDSKVKKEYNLAEELPYYYIVDENRKILYRDKDLNSVLNKIDELI